MRARGALLPCGALACLLLSGGVLVAALPGLAEAEESCSRRDRAEAARLKREARRAMDRDPATAADHLEAAHARCPDPWYLGHLAVLYEELGRIQDAIRAIDAYLDSPGVRQREDALAARDRLRAMLVVIDVSSDPPRAEVFLDGERAPHAATTPARLEVSPGEHTIELFLEGYEMARRDVDAAPGEELRVDVVLERPAGRRPRGFDEPAEPEPFGAREEPGHRWTGGAQVGLGALVPLATDELQPFVGLGLDVGGGLDFGPARVELVLDLWVTPAPDGYILVANAGPRAGIRLGSLPLWVEAAALVGLGFMQVDVIDRQIERGQYLSLGALLGAALCWRVVDWLELLARPARVELLGLAGDSPSGLVARWGLDIGARFRL